MAAVVKIYSYTGVLPGAGVAVEVPNDVIRFKLIDNNIKNDSNRCIRPALGYHYSFKKTIALYATVAPDVSINNCKFYTDGNLDAGGTWISCLINVGDQQSDTYERAIIDPLNSSSGKELTDYDEISSVTDAFSYTIASPLILEESISWIDIVGRITKYLCFQLKVGNLSVSGLQTAEMFTFQYDEV